MMRSTVSRTSLVSPEREVFPADLRDTNPACS
jgi:hypothetical protein